LQRAQRLRQAVLRRAFTGQLAPQDPEDEPAIMLLERIRAERITSPRTSRKSAPRRGKGQYALW
jgi:type I restriction enzyme S subunit